MSTLILVRHGQPRSFTDDADRLSDLGFRQSELLGEYWKLEGLKVDAAYHGSLRRQRETGEQVAETYGAAFPALQVIEGLNEYDAGPIMSHLAPLLAERDAGFGALYGAWKAGGPKADENKRFQLMFEPLTTCWCEDALSSPDVEPFSAFRVRVRAALDQMMREAKRGSTVVAFTSGGVIGTAIQQVLRAPAIQALHLNWRVRNSSLTPFLFGGGRMSLDGFNLIPHLTSPEVISFR